MFWKRMPYWLRGGVVCGGVTIASAILAFGCPQMVYLFLGNDPGFVCLPFVFISPLFPIYIIWERIQFFDKLPFLLSPLFGTIVWFLLGSFAGFLIGLIKKKSPSVR